MKSRQRACLLASLALLLCSLSVSAETWTYGKIQELYPDPQDVVFRLDTNGSCGDNFFVLHRSNTNFQEVFKIFSTAFFKDVTVGIAVVACEDGTRNTISHGSAKK